MKGFGTLEPEIMTPDLMKRKEVGTAVLRKWQGRSKLDFHKSGAKESELAPI